MSTPPTSAVPGSTLTPPELDTLRLRDELGSWARGPAVPAAVPAQLRLPELLDGARAELTAASVARPEPQVGDVLDGRYELGRVLGRGGMGVVFSAQNRRTGQAVAIKYIAADCTLSRAAARDAAQRMRREALAAGRVRHPNVVELYDVGGDDDAPYLVMELLQGESLAQRIARGCLGWDESVALLVPVLRGLGAVHQAGIVHRDLKPENVFLASGPDGQTTPKLLDFGVARLRSASGEVADALTRTGGVIGTPAYMPLEQLTGGPVDVRSDLFAASVVLYEMLTGAFPHRASNAGELAVLRATVDPAPPAARGVNLGRRREALLMKGLAKGAAQRFPDAAAFADALLEAPAASGAVRRLGWLALLIGLCVGLGLRWGAVPRSRPPAAAEVRGEAGVAAPASAAPAIPVGDASTARVAGPEQVRASTPHSEEGTAKPRPARSAQRARRTLEGPAAAPVLPADPRVIRFEDF
jgi:Protein kinase domain